MSKYRIIKEYNVGSGYLYNSAGVPVPHASLSPKVGDIIEGNITQSYVGNSKRSGIKYKISTGYHGESSYILIPKESLRLVLTKNFLFLLIPIMVFVIVCFFRKKM